MHARAVPHARLLKKKTDRILASNVAYLRYCVSNLVCSSLGAYRHCRVRPSFAKCLEVHARFGNLATLDEEGARQFFRQFDHVAQNVLRENATLHIRHNVAFHEAVVRCFPAYVSFERKWIDQCMDSYRSMLEAGLDIAAIDGEIQRLYGRNTLFVYRRPQDRFPKIFVWPAQGGALAAVGGGLHGKRRVPVARHAAADPRNPSAT